MEHSQRPELTAEEKLSIIEEHFYAAARWFLLKLGHDLEDPDVIHIEDRDEARDS